MPETITMFTATCTHHSCHWRTSHATSVAAELALMAHSLGHPYIYVGVRGTIAPSTTLAGWTPTDDRKFQEMFNG